MIIVNNPEAIRLKCEDVRPEEVGPLVLQLEQELEHSAKLGRPGIGLSSPQINIAKNIAIVRIDNLYKVNLINCKIENQYDRMMFKDEGCLSFPGRVENTLRYQEIHITDNLVYPHSFIASGLFSVCIQHELDHLQGILLPDVALPKVKLNKKIGPNDKCLCGSGLKFKRCCQKEKII